MKSEPSLPDVRNRAPEAPQRAPLLIQGAAVAGVPRISSRPCFLLLVKDGQLVDDLPCTAAALPALEALYGILLCCVANVQGDQVVHVALQYFSMRVELEAFRTLQEMPGQAQSRIAEQRAQTVQKALDAFTAQDAKHASKPRVH